MKITTNKKDLAPIVRDLLLKKSAKTQEEICQALKKHGHQTNQTKISRLLKKLGATKLINERGEITYWLPKESPPANLSSLVNNLVTGVTANESTIIIHTTPGAASVIARVIDYLDIHSEILGTIAGDDTIFVAPKSITNIKVVYENLKSRLGFT